MKIGGSILLQNVGVYQSTRYYVQNVVTFIVSTEIISNIFPIFQSCS